MPSDSGNDPMRDVTLLLINVQDHLDLDVNLKPLARRYGYSPLHFHR
jgi:hypothetical protein